MTITSFEEWLQQVDTDSEDVTKDKDELYQFVKEGYEMFDGSNKVDLTWRMGRAAFKVSAAAEVAKDVEKQKKYLKEAEEWLKKALEKDGTNVDANLWMANVYGKLSDHLGTKERIAKGKEIQKHLEATIAGRPDDFNAYYTYGRWCIEVASLSWMERKIAAVVFDKPPESTYQDAVEKFVKVQELRPGWKANAYFAAKCFIQMKQFQEAIKWADLASEMESKDEEDRLIEADLGSIVKKYAAYR